MLQGVEGEGKERRLEVVLMNVGIQDGKRIVVMAAVQPLSMEDKLLTVPGQGREREGGERGGREGGRERGGERGEGRRGGGRRERERGLTCMYILGHRSD